MAGLGELLGGFGGEGGIINFGGMAQFFSYFFIALIAVGIGFIIFFIIKFSRYRMRIIVTKDTANGSRVWFDKGRRVRGKSGQPDQIEFFWSGNKIPDANFKNVYSSTPSWLAFLYGGGETLFLNQKEEKHFLPMIKAESDNPGVYFDVIPQDTEAIRLAEEKRILADYAPDKSFWEMWGTLIIIVLTLLASAVMLGILAYSINSMQSQNTAQLKEISTALVDIIKSKNLIG